MDSLDEIISDKDAIISDINKVSNELFILGSNKERILFFEKLRNLILEKDLQGDPIAVEILSWAYDQLANY